jgi:hypothetical protein
MAKRKFGKKPRARKHRARKPRSGGKGNAWRKYVGHGVSNAPLPD